jgi:hypothetical protein
MVIALANTGSEVISKTEVIKIDQEKSEIRIINILGFRMFKIVVKKLIDPKIKDEPDICKEKIARSTEIDGEKVRVDKGGYTVQPVPAPPSIMLLLIKAKIAGIAIQKLKLFKRGSAISIIVSIVGRKKLPNAPISTGVTTKKIIINPWAVITTLYI